MRNDLAAALPRRGWKFVIDDKASPTNGFCLRLRRISQYDKLIEPKL
jgi:hypothetical protein